MQLMVLGAGVCIVVASVLVGYTRERMYASKYRHHIRTHSIHTYRAYYRQLVDGYDVLTGSEMQDELGQDPPWPPSAVEARTDGLVFYHYCETYLEVDHGRYPPVYAYTFRCLGAHGWDDHVMTNQQYEMLISELRPLMVAAMQRDDMPPRVVRWIEQPDVDRARYNWLLVFFAGLPTVLFVLGVGGAIVYIRYIVIREHRTAIQRRRARAMICARCKYSLRGLSSTRCPECGTAFDSVRIKAAQEPTGAGDG
jgi:hypothetical protein